jgi:hypothetical protein
MQDWACKFLPMHGEWNSRRQRAWPRRGDDKHAVAVGNPATEPGRTSGRAAT